MVALQEVIVDRVEVCLYLWSPKYYASVGIFVYLEVRSEYAEGRFILDFACRSVESSISFLWCSRVVSPALHKILFIGVFAK
ncbi:hypothetical protein PGB90_001468 [Kerria lacca]